MQGLISGTALHHYEGVHLTIDPWATYERLGKVAHSDVHLRGIGETELQQRSREGSSDNVGKMGTDSFASLRNALVTTRWFQILAYEQTEM